MANLISLDKTKSLNLAIGDHVIARIKHIRIINQQN